MFAASLAGPTVAGGARRRGSLAPPVSEGQAERGLRSRGGHGVLDAPPLESDALGVKDEPSERRSAGRHAGAAERPRERLAPSDHRRGTMAARHADVRLTSGLAGLLTMKLSHYQPVTWFADARPPVLQ
jgi:hypothetical protein